MARLGLDFGNTKCFVSFFNDNGSIEDLNGQHYRNGYPSVFAYSASEDKELFGDLALNERYSDCRKILLKRALRSSGNGKDEEFTLGGKTFKTSYAIKRVLTRVLNNATAILDRNYHKTVTEICLAYPVEFSEEDILFLVNIIDSIELESGAHPNVTRVISEPEAAALDYLGSVGITDKDTVICFDFGGGTLDVCSLTVWPERNSAISSVTRVYSGSSQDDPIGGHDFTERLAEIVAEKLTAEFGEEAVARIPRSLIYNNAEKIKLALTDSETSLIDLSVNGVYSEQTISRREFEERVADLVEKTVKITKDVYFDTVPKAPPSKIILVGGASQMPIIERKLKEAFDPYKVEVVSHNPQSAISFGAARFAHFVIPSDPSISKTGNTPQKDRPGALKNGFIHYRTVKMDLAVLTLESETSNRSYLKTVVPRGTKIPYLPAESRVFRTEAETSTIQCFLYEAKTKTPDNYEKNDYKKILDLTLELKEPVPAHSETMVKVSVDIDGKVTMNVLDPKTGLYKAGNTVIKLVNYK